MPAKGRRQEPATSRPHQRKHFRMSSSMYGKKDRLQKHVNVCRHIPPNVRQEFLTKLPHEDVIETTWVKRKQLDENEQKSIDCLIVKGIALKNIPFSIMIY